MKAKKKKKKKESKTYRRIQRKPLNPNGHIVIFSYLSVEGWWLSHQSEWFGLSGDPTLNEYDPFESSPKTENLMMQYLLHEKEKEVFFLTVINISLHWTTMI